MKHLGTESLETQRLVLRRFTLGDAEAMYKNWASDTEVTKYLTWPAHQDVAVTRMVLKKWVDGYSVADNYEWAIALRESPCEPIGSISVVYRDDSIAAAQIGYCIGRKWWHRGITSEALKRVMDYLFDEVGMNRIEARHDTQNPHSGAVMEKCGMRYEGTMRQAGRNNQGISDLCYYALLASDRK
ncbi:MAG: GNAT family N-acetyltransferase [Hungatella sp.]|nr:GNAT family N-acetyltransferase [Hungatella sp.]MDR1548037.1 GNAT family N-acetyltransferase [Hungatella sp.]